MTEEENKVPTVENGLATGVQSVGGVPVLIKDEVSKVGNSAEAVEAAKEKDKVLAAFHSEVSGSGSKKAPEAVSDASGKESEVVGKDAGLATGVQTGSGIPILSKQVTETGESKGVGDAVHAGNPSKELAAASLSDMPTHSGASSLGSEVKPKAGGVLATGVQSSGGIPILTKQVAEVEKPDDANVAAKQKERVLTAFHSNKSPEETASTTETKGESAPIAETEPVVKERRKSTMASLKDKVALAFKSEKKEQVKGTEGTEGEKGEDHAADDGAADKEGVRPASGPTLKDRVYQSVGSFGEKVKSQAASLRRSTSKSENKEGVEEKSASTAATPTAVPPTAVTPMPGTPTQTASAKEGDELKQAAAAPDLASPGVEKATVKELMIQRMGSLSDKMKSAWKPEDKKTATKEDSNKGLQEETSKEASTPGTSSQSVPSHSHGKGRVTVFSISGCPHCKAAKALLKKKGVRFAEVNLDVFPERRGEMQERTGKSSCPQIFFNDKLIGGNDALQALENEGKLDAELQLVHETPVPETAPAPAGPQKAAATSPALDRPPDEHLPTVQLLREKVPVKDRWYKLRKYERCFVGSEAVDLLVEERKISRQAATSLLQLISTKHFFHHVVREHAFKDGPFFYRFLEHEPFVKTAANWGSATSDTEPPPAVELGNQLRKLILAVYDEFLSDDGRHVDYQGIAKSEIFRRYVQLSLQLQRVDVLGLSREEKLALFINLYNALVIHVTVVLGYGPTTLGVRRHFFTEHTYVIGGSAYSLTAIENGILRGNKRPPFFFSKPFGEKDDRLPVALTTSEPLIHFALVCGAKSCPPVKTYEPKAVDEALKAAAQGFFEGGGVRIDVETKTIHLSKILSWYKSDFGGTDLEVLKFVARFLTLKERDKLEALVSEGKYKIEYQPYDWSANSNE